MIFKNAILAVCLVVFGLSVGCQDEGEQRLCPCHDGLQIPLFKGCSYMDDCWKAQQCASNELLSEVYGSIKYPVEARENSVQGRVVLEFDVDIYGVARNFRVQSDTLGYGIPEAAIEGAAIVNERGFYPAEEDCALIEYTFVLPISFKL